LPSPHFNLTELAPTVVSSSTGGYGGRARVVTLIGILNAPTPTEFTACTRTLKQKEHYACGHPDRLGGGLVSSG